jgi:alpha-galactosidase
VEIAVIGAGSHFNLALLRSLYQTATHEDYHLRFVDARPGALEALSRLLPRMNALTGRSFRFSCHTERPGALEGADHVLACFAVDFPASFLRTCWVMRDHGIQFVEGETATPGALMATLRHLPILLGIAEEMRRRADGAWLHVINNPMPRLVRGVIVGAGYERVVGHCHGTLGVRRRIAELTGTRAEEVDLFVAGINHFHLVQRAVHTPTGRSLLAELGSLPDEVDVGWRRADFTQWRMFHELGYLVGHGIWHNFDYLPYANQRMFRHRDDNTWERACLRVLAVRAARPAGETGDELADVEALGGFLAEPEHEQVFSVMQALSGERAPYAFLSGNAPNRGHIPGLPDGAIVELPATVTPDGVRLHPSPAPLPLFFEAWLRQQLAVHELSVRAALEGSRQAAVEAIACDPAFRDCDCGPGELLDEMLAANERLVPALR